MKLKCVGHEREYDLQSIASAFFPGQSFSEGLPLIESKCVCENGRLICKTLISGDNMFETGMSSCPENGSIQRIVKESFYEAAVKYTGITPPWGEFSGIRPVKFMSSLDDDIACAEKKFMENYKVSFEKARLCSDTLRLRKKLDFTFGRRDFSLYVAIPFCPTRCSYCSFISQAAEKMLKLIPDYLVSLKEEIKDVGRAAKENDMHLRSVYIGGGTPGILTAYQLSDLCLSIGESFDMSDLCEYTAELGRPDVITRDKLIAVKNAGVDRVSINPQTLNDSVLEAIGRKHTAAQFFDAFNEADKLSFRSINTDLIVGLPDDTPESFSQTVSGILKLNPGNITVHSLCLKKSSRFKTDAETEFLKNKNAIAMSKNALDLLFEENYLPYYIYKQKNAIGALENTGFCRDGLAGYYNMVMMDDLQTVIGVGAGGASKLKNGAQIRRIYNHKYPFEYMSRIERQKENLEEIVKFFNSID